MSSLNSRESIRQLIQRGKSLVERRAAVAGEGFTSAAPASLGGTGSDAERNHKKKVVRRDLLNAHDSKEDFVRYYYHIIRQFVADKTKFELEVPSLDGYDRLVVHAIAEKCNLSHISSGNGEKRLLRLKKDELFFRHPDAVDHVNLEEISRKIGEKESKYHVRHLSAKTLAERRATLQPGDVGSYADEDVYAQSLLLKRDTDAYLFATDMGFSNEELLAEEAGGERPPLTTGTTSLSAGQNRLLDMVTRADALPRVPSASSAVKQQPMRPPPSRPVKATEVCGSCYSRVPLDGAALHQWKCEKFCAVCSRVTIWRREEEALQHEAGVLPHGKRARGEACASAGIRVQEADPATLPYEAPTLKGGAEAIEREADEELRLEDAMDLISMNDFSAADSNWLRQFASAAVQCCQECTSQSGPLLGLHDYMVFCIDFQDLLHLNIFKRYESQALKHRETSVGEVPTETDQPPPAQRRRDEVAESGVPEHQGPLYVVVREHKAASTALHALLGSLLQHAYGEKGTIDLSKGHMAVALLNGSVYGIEAIAICQLRPVLATSETEEAVLSLSQEGLTKLQEQYGEDHVYITWNLEDAVHKTEEFAL